MAINIILVALGWLLAAGSGVLWFRKYPGRRLGWAYPKRGWLSDALLLLATAVAAYGGSNLQLRQHWDVRWLVVAVVLPISVIAGVVPRIVRWRQLRRSASRTGSLDSSAGVPPTA